MPPFPSSIRMFLCLSLALATISCGRFSFLELPIVTSAEPSDTWDLFSRKPRDLLGRFVSCINYYAGFVVYVSLSLSLSPSLTDSSWCVFNVFLAHVICMSNCEPFLFGTYPTISTYIEFLI